MSLVTDESKGLRFVNHGFSDSFDVFLAMPQVKPSVGRFVVSFFVLFSILQHLSFSFKQQDLQEQFQVTRRNDVSKGASKVLDTPLQHAMLHLFNIRK